MKQLINWYYKVLEIIVVVCLGAMCLMVFGNVLLRHFFDSGINISEELSRFMFIWLTFLGAIVTMRDGGHLGVDMVVRRLSPNVQFGAVLLAQTIVLICCGVFLWGLIKQHSLNVANRGLVTDISLGVVYSAAYLCALSIGIFSLANIARLLLGKISPESLIPATDSD